MNKTKKDWREFMIKELAQLDENQRKDISKKLQEVLFQSKLWKKAETIGLYLSFKTEWDTRNIVQEAFKQGKNVAIPKTIPDKRRLDFYQITGYSQVEKVQSGNFTIEEPIIEEAIYLDKNKIDLIIVPGLIFSKDGYRIGFGGGYYDRFLADFNNETVSLVSLKQLRDSIPTNKYDIPVKHIIAEEGLVS